MTALPDQPNSAPTPDRLVEMTAARPMRKWPRIAAFWAAQTALVFLFFPLLEAVTDGSWSRIPRYFTDPEYMLVATIYAAVVTGLQAAFLAPIARPGAKQDARPSLWRVLACGMGLGLLAGLLAAFVLFAVDMLDLAATDPWKGEFFLVIPATALIVGIAATTVMRAKFRDGIPVKFSLMFMVLLAGLLLTGVIALIFDSIELVLDSAGAAETSLPDWVWISGWLGGPIVGWVIATPLIFAFARKGHPEAQFSRLANRLFLGTVIEAVVTVPIDVMVRRKTSCYCGEGTFWALIICGSVGLITLGPAMYLLPIGRRRKRLVAGCCAACGYDMRGSPNAERCPECGAGWKANG